MNRKFWTNYNPHIIIEDTAKKYFGRYLYKIVLRAPGGRLIDSKGSIEEALEHRREINKNINRWWSRGNINDLDKADVALLTTLRELRHSSLLKMRIEEPRVQIYAATEKELENLVIDHLRDFPHSYIEAVSGPKDTQAEKILNSGAIIKKTDIGYRYKVVIRDGRYGSDIKTSILQYLQKLDKDQVHLSKGGENMLSNKSNYVWNLFFHCNDLSICTFLELIQPGLILNSHEIIVHK
jgi:hypothetical protein